MMALRWQRLAFTAIAATTALAPALNETAAADRAPRLGQPGKDVMWLPTPDDMVVKMLDLAQVAAGERLVDLGSGDGKIAIAAAKRGALAKGIEYDAEMVAHSRRLAAQAGVDVELVQGDIFASDFSRADVVTMYLLDTLNERLRPTLLAMKPGTRVVSYRFGMGAWEPTPPSTAGPTTRTSGAFPPGSRASGRSSSPAIQARRCASSSDSRSSRGASCGASAAARCAMRRFAARS